MKARLLAAGLAFCAIVAVACGSGKAGVSDNGRGAPTVMASVVPSSAPTSVKASPEPLGTREETDVGDLPPDEVALGLLWQFQPMLLMSQMMFGGEEGEGLGSGLKTLDKVISGEADTQLTSVLISLDDLPPEYYSMYDRSGEFTTSPDRQKIALRWFMSADPASEPIPDEVITMVSTVAVRVPTGVQPELETKLRELKATNDCLLEENQLEPGDEEDGITECRVSEVEDLGDVGIGIHMIMASDGDIGGTHMESYLFKRGDGVYALHISWTNGDISGVDALALAKIMDSRAQAASD